MHCAILLNNLPLWNCWQHKLKSLSCLSPLCTSLFFSPFYNKDKGFPYTPPDSIHIKSIIKSRKKEGNRDKSTPHEIVCLKASQCCGKVITPSFFHRYSKTCLGNGLVNISTTCFDVGINSNFTFPATTFSFKK